MRERLRLIPRPLALLLPVVALFGLAWVLIVPAWGNPDEDAHFAYSQTLVERGELPGSGERQVSSEQRLSMDYTNTDETTFFPQAKPEWSEPVEREWESKEGAAARGDGGASNATIQYPPAYYLWESLGYGVASSGDVMTRVYAMRVVSLFWLLVATVAAWLLAGEVFGRRRPLQLVTAAAVGLWPTVVWITASVNPDGMLIALWALSTWLAVSLVGPRVSALRAAGLCLCLGLALVTKASALALVPPVALALGVAAFRARHGVTMRRLLATAAVIAPLVLLVGAWAIVASANDRSAYGQTALVSDATAGGAAEDAPEGTQVRPASVREFGSYLWQFYLPKLGFQHEIRFMFPVISEYPAYQTWLGGGWATFGWANVWFADWVYLVFLAATLLALLGAAVAAIRALRRREWRDPHRLRVIALLLVTVGTLVAGLHWTDFHQYLRREPPFLQGRYLLPLAPIFALVLALATRSLPRRFQPAGQATVVAALVVLQLACLGLVAARFYA